MKANVLKKTPRFSVELDMGGDDVTHMFEGGAFRGLDELASHGDTLDELLAYATISTQDQDGGECRCLSLGDFSDEFIFRQAERIAEEICACSEEGSCSTCSELQKEREHILAIRARKASKRAGA